MGLCLHPLVSVPDAVGRGTTVDPWLQADAASP